MNSKNILFNSSVGRHFVEIFPITSNRKWEIDVPASKSYSNRILILGAIVGKGFRASNLSTSTDVLNLLSGFRAIGIEFEDTNNPNEVIFSNSFFEAEASHPLQEVHIYTGDGGTTNRFLLALLSRGKKKYHIYPSEKLSERPIDDLLGPLKSLGCKFEINNQYDSIKKSAPWLTVQGPVDVSTISQSTVNCRFSTQFASALKLVFFNEKINWKLIHVENSKKYLELTDELIKKVNNGQKYFEIPIDFSSASYPLALAALGGSLLIKNCSFVDQFQADSIFVNLLTRLGADIKITDDGLFLNKALDLNLNSFEFDVSIAPDLFPTLVFLASFIKSESKFKNLEVLKYKESNRLEEMLKLLNLFNVEHILHKEKNELVIVGPPVKMIDKIQYFPPADHRIVMAATLFMKMHQGGEIFNHQCVNKSYPGFFESFA